MTGVTEVSNIPGTRCRVVYDGQAEAPATKSTDLVGQFLVAPSTTVVIQHERVAQCKARCVPRHVAQCISIAWCVLRRIGAEGEVSAISSNGNLKLDTLRSPVITPILHRNSQGHETASDPKLRSGMSTTSQHILLPEDEGDE